MPDTFCIYLFAVDTLRLKFVEMCAARERKLRFKFERYMINVSIKV